MGTVLKGHPVYKRVHEGSWELDRVLTADLPVTEIRFKKYDGFVEFDEGGTRKRVETEFVSGLVSTLDPEAIVDRGVPRRSGAPFDS